MASHYPGQEGIEQLCVWWVTRFKRYDVRRSGSIFPGIATEEIKNSESTLMLMLKDAWSSLLQFCVLQINPILIFE